MQLLEYQAKELLKRSGISVPDSTVVQAGSSCNPEELSYPVVLKSQVPIGGRGKLGGIRLVTSADEFLATFPEVKALEIKGYKPEAILVEQAIQIERELYIALKLNRDMRRIDVIASSQGGVEIESHTSSVISVPYDDKNASETVAKTLNIDQNASKTLLEQLYECMSRNDLLLLEVNPLVVTKKDTLVAADAKCVLDDNALFRHPDYANQAVSSSVLALGGTVGVIANGAGMAMSTMDAIYAHGGRPANFLDIGGGTGEDVFIKNLREITALPRVTSIIINIFAGITRCDDIARGIIAAKREIPDLVPLYIRLEGTRRDEAVALLKEASIAIMPDLATCVELALKNQAYSATRSTLASGGTKLQIDTTSDSAGEDTSIKKHLQPEHDKAPGPLLVPGAKPLNDGMYRGVFGHSPVIVQGITGHHGSFHTQGMIAAGTNIVAGVTPGKGGQSVHDIPVYNSVSDALKTHHATTSVVFVPPTFAKSAVLESLDAGIKLVVIITEGIPVHDMLALHTHAAVKNATIVGPNCPGLIIPGIHKLGIIATHITTPGTTAIISRSGTLTYELADALTKKDIGQRIVLGIGGDPIQGMNFSEALQMCEHDPHVDRIVMVGEIGGTSEQIAAEFIKHNVTKPVYGLVVGHSLPAGQQFGHAGAIVGGLGESAKEKTDYMAEQGITMSDTLDELIGQLR